MTSTAENRSLARLACRIVVSDRAHSAPIGEITDMTLDGIFVATATPLNVGALFPLVFNLGAGECRPMAEVVRVTPQGMGLRFLTMSAPDARSLRRHIVQNLAEVGKRDAVARLLDVGGSATRPLTDPESIAKLFEHVDASVSFTVMPASRVDRVSAILRGSASGQLSFSCADTGKLSAKENVIVLYACDFISYSFRATVVSIGARKFSLTLPTSVQYSERRASNRDTMNEPCSISFPVPWNDNQPLTWEVLDRSAAGLSFKANPQDSYFWPGTPLRNVMLHDAGREEALSGVVVKHLTAMHDAEGAWLKVGLAVGAERSQPKRYAGSVPLVQESRGFWQRCSHSLGRIRTFLSYYRAKKALRSKPDKVHAFNVVRFKNRLDQPMTGLLNTAFPQDERIRAPLIIITPAFGGRKETMSALALTLVDNFRRQHRDVAVLRYDGTNNLGESYKSQGCERDGYQTLKYTISAGTDDFLGALDWAQENPLIEPTETVVISVSLSSIAVAHVLSLPEAAHVSQWIAFMGAADAPNACMNAAGHIDGWGNFMRGIKTGVVSVMGCLTDVDHLCEDMHAKKMGTLDDMRRDIARVQCDVTWIVGTQDAIVDPRRVNDLMTVSAPGKREVIEVNAGHVPKSSDEALAVFTLMTGLVWHHLYGRELSATPPSRGFLAAHAEREWTRVRSPPPVDATAWWRSYLLGNGKLSFDVWAFTPQYQELMNDQVRALAGHPAHILDLGAGTGNLTQALYKSGLRQIVAMDLVPEALELLRTKVSMDCLQLATGSADGSPRVAMQRWLRGDLGDLSQLIKRLPAGYESALKQFAMSDSSLILNILRGAQLDQKAALKQANLPEHLATPLRDIHCLARFCRGLVSLDDALNGCAPPMWPVLRAHPGLPFADQSFDAVMCSLVLSYLKHPDDALSEMRRVLRNGGQLIISSILPDADTSKTFAQAIEFFESMPEKELPPGHSRADLLAAARYFLSSASKLLHLQEEGNFQFFDAQRLTEHVLQAGFESVTQILSYGDPPMAIIVKCIKV